MERKLIVSLGEVSISGQIIQQLQDVHKQFLKSGLQSLGIKHREGWQRITVGDVI